MEHTNDAHDQQTQTTGSRFSTAYQTTLAEMAALRADDLTHINVDVAAAVTSALGAWPEIKAARAEIAQAIPGFDLAQFDKLERYALATGHAHALYTVAQGPSASLPELGEQALALRDLLWTDAMVLAKRGLLDAGRIKDLRATTGYRNVAFDLLGLVAVMRESWSQIAGKTAIQGEELDHAEQLADRIISEVGLREQGPAMLASASDNRQRAFTLFVRCYDQARRVLSYLRWEAEDVDTIAPSLYAGRNARRRAAVAKADLPAVTVPAAGAPQAASVPVASSAVGLPGSEPFTR